MECSRGRGDAPDCWHQGGLIRLSSERKSNTRESSTTLTFSTTPCDRGSSQRELGERFVAGYKPISTVDLLMKAPFEE